MGIGLPCCTAEGLRRPLGRLDTRKVSGDGICRLVSELRVRHLLLVVSVMFLSKDDHVLYFRFTPLKDSAVAVMGRVVAARESWSPM